MELSPPEFLHGGSQVSIPLLSGDVDEVMLNKMRLREVFRK